jgi:aldehyde:ferredoxin oxidoreductase
MWYGRTGSYLEVDLSQGRIEKKEGDSKLNGTFLGGRGTATKLLWDRVAPETEPFSPSNLLIFDTGVFTGTLVPGSNRGSVVTRSPQTNLLTYSVFGGFWPAELKRAGYDGIIISGKSPTPVYLWINDDNMEIRDASYLWGRD